MVTQAFESLTSLYESDETAWLDAMAELIRERRYEHLDYPNLAGYLTDMARRDRREVKSRLRTLLTHLLKWIYQPDKRSRSWQATINTQRRDLADAAEKGVLRKHAEEILPDVFTEAVEAAVIETELFETSFPRQCPWTIDDLLTRDLAQ